MYYLNGLPGRRGDQYGEADSEYGVVEPFQAEDLQFVLIDAFGGHFDATRGRGGDRSPFDFSSRHNDVQLTS